MGKANNIRLHEIDGIRGWAALMVIFFHLFWEIFGVTHPAFRNPFTKFLLDGPLAVYVFFVLSGDALATPFFLSGNTDYINKLTVKRYPRLVGPILLSCLLTYCLMKAKLTFNVPAGAIINRPDWLGSFLPFSPSLSGMLHYAFYDVFANHSVTNSYNAFMWPMGVELVGSMLVVAFLHLKSQLTRPLAVTATCALWLFIWNSYFCLFFAGMTLSLLRVSGTLERIRSSAAGKNLGPLLLILCAVADGFLWLYRITPSVRVYSLLAILIVLAIYSNTALVKFFSNRLSRFLGNISFPLYVIHFSVICSLTSWLIVQVGKPGIQRAAVAVPIALISIATAMVLAFGLTLLEQRYLKLLNRWTAMLLSKKQA